MGPQNQGLPDGRAAQGEDRVTGGRPQGDGCRRHRGQLVRGGRGQGLGQSENNGPTAGPARRATRWGHLNGRSPDKPPRVRGKTSAQNDELLRGNGRLCKEYLTQNWDSKRIGERPCVHRWRG